MFGSYINSIVQRMYDIWLWVCVCTHAAFSQEFIYQCQILHQVKQSFFFLLFLGFYLDLCGSESELYVYRMNREHWVPEWELKIEKSLK